MILPVSPYATVDLSGTATTEMPSLTYKLDLVTKRIIGWIDEEDAMLQAIEKIFLTERFAYLIYTSLYGIELEGLIGKSLPFVQSVLESRIKDAVLADDRVLGISDYNNKVISKDELEVYVVVHTTFGQLEYRRRLQIA